MEQLTDEVLSLFLGGTFEECSHIVNVDTRYAEFKFVHSLSSVSIKLYSSDKHFTIWDLLDKLLLKKMKIW